MPRNVEIKARLADYESMRFRVAGIADSPAVTIAQYDTFFTCATGRLKLRRFSTGEGQLIAYSRPDGISPEASLYFISEIPDPASMTEVLERSNGILGVVEKARELFMIGRTRVHLDRVKDLGDFLELEVVLDEQQTTDEGRSIAEALMLQLGIEEHHLIDVAYIDLLAREPR